MKKTKTQKGITLVALIITIIILLILAVVAIKEVQGDGIIAYAQRAKEEQIQKQDEEAIMLAFNEWKIVSNTQKDKTFAGFMGEKLGTGNVVENADKSLTITMESGNQFTITPAGVITLVGTGTPTTPSNPSNPDNEEPETPTTPQDPVVEREVIKGTWSQSGLTVTVTKEDGTQRTFNVGDDIYTDSGNYKILDVKNSKLRLVSMSFIDEIDIIGDETNGTQPEITMNHLTYDDISGYISMNPDSQNDQALYELIYGVPIGNCMGTFLNYVDIEDDFDYGDGWGVKYLAGTQISEFMIWSNTNNSGVGMETFGLREVKTVAGLEYTGEQWQEWAE